MRLGVVVAAAGALLLSASPAFCDLIPNTRQAPLVIVNPDGSAARTSPTEALLEGELQNNAFLTSGTATDDSMTGMRLPSDSGSAVTLPGTGSSDATPDAVATPEPGSLALFGIGAVLAGFVLRRRYGSTQEN